MTTSLPEDVAATAWMVGDVLGEDVTFRCETRCCGPSRSSRILVLDVTEAPHPGKRDRPTDRCQNRGPARVPDGGSVVRQHERSTPTCVAGIAYRHCSLPQPSQGTAMGEGTCAF
jgi:hypothetical protein